MKNLLETILLATVAFAFSTGCIAEVEEDDPDFRFAAEPVGEECEVYYFVVDGATERAALTACEGVCEGVLCPDFEFSATASIAGQAGDADTWKCDCTCPCADAEPAPREFGGAQQL